MAVLRVFDDALQILDAFGDACEDVVQVDYFEGYGVVVAGILEEADDSRPVGIALSTDGILEVLTVRRLTPAVVLRFGGYVVVFEMNVDDVFRDPSDPLDVVLTEHGAEIRRIDVDAEVGTIDEPNQTLGLLDAPEMSSVILNPDRDIHCSGIIGDHLHRGGHSFQHILKVRLFGVVGKGRSGVESDSIGAQDPGDLKPPDTDVDALLAGLVVVDGEIAVERVAGDV